MPFCKRLYLTSVETTIDGDVFMPPLGDGWVLDSEEKFSADEKNQYATTFKVFSRK